MSPIDLLILIAFGAGALMGLLKGFIKQLASLLGLVVGLLTAKALYATVAERLCPLVTDSMTVARVIAFLLIWVAVPLAFSLVAALLTKAMEAVTLGWLNRLLGAGLGALKALLLVSLAICILEYIDSDSQLISRTKKSGSALYYPMHSFAALFIPAATQLVTGDKGEGI